MPASVVYTAITARPARDPATNIDEPEGGATADTGGFDEPSWLIFQDEFWNGLVFTTMAEVSCDVFDVISVTAPTNTATGEAIVDPQYIPAYFAPPGPGWVLIDNNDDALRLTTWAMPGGLPQATGDGSAAAIANANVITVIAPMARALAIQDPTPHRTFDVLAEQRIVEVVDEIRHHDVLSEVRIFEVPAGAI